MICQNQNYLTQQEFLAVLEHQKKLYLQRPMESVEVDLKKRFFKKVYKVENSCWVWLSAVWGNNNSYGCFHCPERKHGIRAHRYSWEMVNGKIPKGLCACHKCNNKLCVNPDHIFIGTHTDNLRGAAKDNLLVKINDEFSHISCMQKRYRLRKKKRLLNDRKMGA